MVFYIIAAAERVNNANGAKVDSAIQYTTEEQVSNKIKSTKTFIGDRQPSTLHKMEVRSRVEITCVK